MSWRIGVNAPTVHVVSIPASSDDRAAIAHHTRKSAGFMQFEPIGDVRHIETIAVGHGIRELARLKKAYGGRRWRKLKGYATVNLNGSPVEAEVHWYECHGIGRKEMRIIRIFE